MEKQKNLIDLTHISLVSGLCLIMRNIRAFSFVKIQVCHIQLQCFQRLDVCVNHSTCKSPETFISTCFCQNYLLSDKTDSNIRILQKSCFAVTMFKHP